MNIHQLQQLFHSLPDSFVQEIGEKEFNTCWYGSSALDPRPMEVLDYSHPDAIIAEKVDVFFYTDIGFLKCGDSLLYDTVLCNFENGTLKYNENTVDILKGEILGFSPFERISKTESLNIVSNQLWKYFSSVSYWGWKNDMKYHAVEVLNKKFNLQRIEHDYLQEFGNEQDFENSVNKEMLKLLGMESEYQAHKNQFVLNRIENLINESFDSFNAENFLNTYQKHACIVRHKRHDGKHVYVFYIDSDDWSFEQLLLKNNIQIDYTTASWGTAGPGPRLLGNLGARYNLIFSRNHFSEDEIVPVDRIDFKLEPTDKRFLWHNQDDSYLLNRVVID